MYSTVQLARTKLGSIREARAHDPTGLPAVRVAMVAAREVGAFSIHQTFPKLTPAQFFALAREIHALLLQQIR